MKLLVLRSTSSEPRTRTGPAYLQHFDEHYAQKVLDNLMDKPGFCTACGNQCNSCRTKHQLPEASASIAAVLDFPSVLPHVLEKTNQYLSCDMPPHEVLLAIHIHEQILLELLRMCPDLGTKGVIVPLEANHWLSNAGKIAASAICESAGIEIAFPKPFCALKPPAGSVLAEFRRLFRVGYPEVRLQVQDNTITNACVEVSAACGATYFIARSLTGKRLSLSLQTEVVSKALHSYPCTASMQIDPDIGDTPLHVAGQAHYKILAPWEGLCDKEEAPLEQENVFHMRKAREAILQAVEKGPIEMAGLMKNPDLIPAAVSSALILLKKQQRIRVDGGIVSRFSVT